METKCECVAVTVVVACAVVINVDFVAIGMVLVAVLFVMDLSMGTLAGGLGVTIYSYDWLLIMCVVWLDSDDG